MDATQKTILAGVLIGIIGTTTWIVISMMWRMLAYPLGRVECAAPECFKLVKVTKENIQAATHGRVFCCGDCFFDGMVRND